MLAVHADAGGSGKGIENDIPVGEELDFDEVINETVSLKKEILYAKPIPAGPVSEAITAIQNLFGAESASTSVNTLIDKLDTYLASTNSDVFYSGEEAQKNIAKMKSIKETIETLAGYSGQIDLAYIEGEIAKYNEHLDNIKLNARRELLEQAAADFNAKNLLYPDYPKYQTCKFARGYGSKPYFNNTDTARYTVTEVSSETKTTTGGTYTEVKYEIMKYKQITCTNGIKCLQTWWDPTFEEIEAQFATVGEPLPYEKKYLQLGEGYKDNNTWGWNGEY